MTAPTVYPDPFRRLLITIPLVLSSMIVMIDVTIANVALPHMQSSLSASQEQVLWVLTSYLIAGAIATPLGAWLAGRFGRRPVLVLSVAVFTFASALCGAANDLSTMLASRALQGASGAMLLPLTQAMLLDINPPERHGKAMAAFSLSAMAGPIAGPTLGGWLTDTLSWRWIFFINLPIGVFAAFMMLAVIPGSRTEAVRKFDMFGFVTVSLALACLQLMLDRGEHLDWFDSAEIQIYALLAITSGYLAVVHLATTRNPFISPALFKDRNFALSNFFSMLSGVITMAAVPMIMVMMQHLLGYSPLHTAIVSAPRAIGMTIGMLAIARFVNLVDTRVILFGGLVLTSIGLAMYTQIDLYTDERALLIAGLIQGIGAGFFFVPLSVVAFSTLNRSLRNEGTAMYSLTRNIGTAVGISMLQREYYHSSADAQSRLGEYARPDNPNVQYGMPDLDFSSTEALVRFNRELVRQAEMVGSIELYQLILVLAVVMIPLLVLIRPVRHQAKSDPLPVME